MAGGLVALITIQQDQRPIAGVAVPFRVLRQPRSRLQGPPTDPPLEPGGKGAAVEAPSGAGCSGTTPLSSCASSVVLQSLQRPSRPSGHTEK
jgi:hypothetical protein